MGQVSGIGKSINEYRNLVGKLARNKPLRKPKHRWKHNIKTDLKKTGLVGVRFEAGVTWLGIEPGFD